MAATFHVVPQWQGSGSSRAMRLADGARAIRSELPMNATVVIDVPSEAGNDEATGVLRISALQQIRDAQLLELGRSSGRVVTIGGDCGVDLAGVQHAAAANPSLAVIWLDAHTDLNTAASSPSGAFHGMVLRTLLGEGPSSLVPSTPVDAKLAILAGARALDDAELDYIESAGIRMIAPDALDGAATTAALLDSGATAVYIHVDLDVLDPAEFASIGYPEPFGVTLSTVLEVIAAAKAALPLVGGAVTEFAPASPDAAADDIDTVLRIIGALAS